MALIENTASVLPVLPRPFRISVKQRLALWKSRRHLAQLDARALEDVGITQAQARREASMTVWDVPESWVGK